MRMQVSVIEMDIGENALVERGVEGVRPEKCGECRRCNGKSNACHMRVTPKKHIDGRVKDKSEKWKRVMVGRKASKKS